MTTLWLHLIIIRQTMATQHNICPKCGGETQYMPPTLYRDRMIMTAYKCLNCGHYFCVEEQLI